MVREMTAHEHSESDGRSMIHLVRSSLTGALGLVLGLLPHVLHHVGFLAGTALLAGAGGTLLFGMLGLAASLPMLIRLYRRFGSMVAPAIAVGIFAIAFAFSSLVLGPVIRGNLEPGGGAEPSAHPSGGDHHSGP